MLIFVNIDLVGAGFYRQPEEVGTFKVFLETAMAQKARGGVAVPFCSLGLPSINTKEANL